MISNEALIHVSDEELQEMRNINATEGYMLAMEAMRRLTVKTAWLTVKEASERYRLTPAQVRYAAKTGAVRERKDSARKIYYAADDLKRLVKIG